MEMQLKRGAQLDASGQREDVNAAACAAVRGRRRDAAIDTRILVAARRQLSCLGYEGMSLASVAEEACTTRQALYRRWPDKAQLAAEAIAATVPLDVLRVSADPRADLECELDDFQQAMAAPSHVSLAGTMLQDATDPRSREQYRRHVIEPRLERIRAILEHAQEVGLLAGDADVEMALTLPTGGWYERHLAGLDVPEDWSHRTADLIWRALGG